jgi:hypothetical protein
MGNTKLDITENQLDYSIPIFPGNHNKKNTKIKKPVIHSLQLEMQMSLRFWQRDFWDQR